MNPGPAPHFFDESDGQKLRIHTISTYLKQTFGRKIVKLSLDGGFTCPNRDGTKAFGGCAFCSASGSGDMASGSGDIRADLDRQIRLLSGKWPDAGYIAYFQSHTNTYAPVEELSAKFTAALQHPDVIGIAIATRPDCLPPDVIDLLDELNQQTFLWVELGVQTIHPETSAAMNLCYCVSDYDDAVCRLRARGIRVVSHLILGLPGETEDMMFQSLEHVCQTKPFGLKLHMFNLVRGSQMEKTHPNYVSFESIDDYIDLVVRMIEHIPPEIVLHRISGDAVRSTLIAPEWSYKKRTILNGIHKKLAEKNTWQGKAL